MQLLLVSTKYSAPAFRNHPKPADDRHVTDDERAALAAVLRGFLRTSETLLEYALAIGGMPSQN